MKLIHINTFILIKQNEAENYKNPAHAVLEENQSYVKRYSRRNKTKNEIISFM